MKMRSPMNRFKMEKTLWERLKFLGYILWGFSLLFFAYALLITPYKEHTDPIAIQQEQPLSSFEGEQELLAEETLNFFIISIIFAFMGTLCLFAAKKRLDPEKIEKD